MRNLDNIEIVSVNCVNPEESVKALLYSTRDITFKAVKLIAHYKPDNLPTNIEFIQIPKQTHSSMNAFHIYELPKYIEADYMLSIHDDGFITNPHLWREEFLDYDYIGAPWPNEAPWSQINRVGNGGFVLKSKKFLNLEQTLPYTNANNDVLVTNTYYDYFKQNGCKYAPVEVAMKFSLEGQISECEYNLDNVFGFHGRGDSWIFKGQGQQFKDKISLLNKI